MRLLAYTSDSKGKFDENNMPTYNLKELAAKGHWYKENDWKNIEMGGYFKLNNADDLGMGYSFSTRSIDDSSTHGGCGGATPKFNIGFDGEIKAKKEMWHISLLDSPGINDEDLSPSIVGKWLGIKGIIYNLPGDKGVKQEFWLDKANDGQWERCTNLLTKGDLEKEVIVGLKNVEVHGINYIHGEVPRLNSDGINQMYHSNSCLLEKFYLQTNKPT